APKPSPSARASGPPRPLATNGRSQANVATAAPLTPTPPVAFASAAQPCKSPNAPAGLSATPQPGDIPAEVRAAATNGTTAVLVHLNADGTVASAAIAGSSGNGSLDLVALTLAKSAQYAPAYKDCKAIAADYTFAAKWIAW
ncbi:MAG: TonB family protein, partial [Candidatus Eremiobacteraeota bacterium]|nr:TonB family protein [Candidatus Eremiobacteraeota bacterium]